MNNSPAWIDGSEINLVIAMLSKVADGAIDVMPWINIDRLLQVVAC